MALYLIGAAVILGGTRRAWRAAWPWPHRCHPRSPGAASWSPSTPHCCSSRGSRYMTVALTVYGVLRGDPERAGEAGASRGVIVDDEGRTVAAARSGATGVARAVADRGRRRLGPAPRRGRPTGARTPPTSTSRGCGARRTRTWRTDRRAAPRPGRSPTRRRTAPSTSTPCGRRASRCTSPTSARSTALRRAAAGCSPPAGSRAPAGSPTREAGWAAVPEPPSPTAVVPIWRRPWMAVGRDTFTGAVLARLGVDNVSRDGPERYPRIDPGRSRRTTSSCCPTSRTPSPPTTARRRSPRRRCSSRGRLLTWYGPSLAEAARMLPGALRR